MNCVNEGFFKVVKIVLNTLPELKSYKSSVKINNAQTLWICFGAATAGMQGFSSRVAVVHCFIVSDNKVLVPSKSTTIGQRCFDFAILRYLTSCRQVVKAVPIKVGKP